MLKNLSDFLRPFSPSTSLLNISKWSFSIFWRSEFLVKNTCMKCHMEMSSPSEESFEKLTTS